MAKKPQGVTSALSDLPSSIELSGPHTLAKGFFAFDRFTFSLPDDLPGTPPKQHDFIRGGKAVAVVAVDPERDAVVLIRQFRPAAQLANGYGDLLEIPAGRVDTGEDAAAAARRECAEEIGVAPAAMVELFTFLTSPGLTDEEITLFVAAVDSTRVAGHAGMAHEGERIETIIAPIAEVVAALGRGDIRNGPCLLGLHWLALNRHRLSEVLAG